MLLNGFFAFSLFSLFSVMVLPSIPFRTRLFALFVSLSISLFTYALSRLRSTQLSLLAWLSSTENPKWSFRSAIFFSLFASLLFYLTPKTGITVSLVSQDGSKKQIVLDLPSFDVPSDRFPWGFIENENTPLIYAARFELKQAIHSLLLYSSYGAADWELDGIPIAHIGENDTSRYPLVVRDIQPGIHDLRCKTVHSTPPPHVSATTGLKEPISGPFFQTNSLLPLFLISKPIPWIFSIVSLFFFIPTINLLVLKLSTLRIAKRKVLIPIGFCFSLLLFLGIRFLFSQNTNQYYEADEAAFGFMAERLLLGQSPPLFHYGQNYQGTMESIPLSILLTMGENLTAALHRLPIVWGILFLFSTAFTFWKYGNSKIALFVFFSLGIGGLHLHWILSNSWFGYSFSLCSGSLLWLIALYGLKKNRLSPFFAISWGGIAGISFYQLPLSFPFIIGSGCILIYLFTISLRGENNVSRRTLFSFRAFWLALYRSGSLLSLVALWITSLPFLISPLLSRQIAPPRVANESPLIDRFLGECLPVFLGVRSPYNHFVDLSSTLIPLFPPLFFLLSVIFFPFISKKVFLGTPFAGKRIVPVSIFFFSISTILIVTYSPFGIWPWYALPLYWSLPIILFTFLHFLWRFSPALSSVSFVCYLMPILTGFFDYNPLFHQPSSLSLQGFWLPTRFDEVKSLLEEKNIRYLLCDQGFDVMYENTGRDWIGDCLLFDSEMRIVSVDRNSRRAPDFSQELLRSSRAGYLFHKDYFFNSPSDGAISPNNSVIFLRAWSKLFGSDFLNYDRFDLNPYVLFLPKEKHPGFDKYRWIVQSSNPIYLSASVDHNMGLRGIGRDAFWSSDRIPEEGCFYKTIFENPKKIQHVLLFHGTKISDRTKENSVLVTLDNGLTYDAGSLSYLPEIGCSYLEFFSPVLAKEVEIKVRPTPDDSWWTIFEVWMY